MKKILSFAVALCLSAYAQTAVHNYWGLVVESGVNALGPDTGTANAYVAANGSATPLQAYSAKTAYTFIPVHANTAASTLKIDSLAAVTIKKLSGGSITDLASGDLCANSVAVVVYDGTFFELVSVPCNGAGGGGGGAFSAITNGTNTTAAMVVGSGATLDYTGTGTIDANKILATALPALSAGNLNYSGSAFQFIGPTGFGWNWVRASSTVMNLCTNGTSATPCTFALNQKSCPVSTPASFTVTGGTGTAYIYGDASCVVHIGESGSLTVGSLTGLTSDGVVTGYPTSNASQIMSCAVSAGVLASQCVPSAVTNYQCCDSTNQGTNVLISNDAQGKPTFSSNIGDTLLGYQSAVATGGMTGSPVSIFNNVSIPALAAGKCFHVWLELNSSSFAGSTVIAATLGGTTQQVVTGLLSASNQFPLQSEFRVCGTTDTSHQQWQFKNVQYGTTVAVANPNGTGISGNYATTSINLSSAANLNIAVTANNGGSVTGSLNVEAIQ